MTTAEYKQMWDRFQRRQESLWATQFRKVLRYQASEYVKTGNLPVEPMMNALIDLYKIVGSTWASKTGLHRLVRKQTKARLPMGFSERIVSLMRQYYGDTYFLNRAELINQTTVEIIEDILSEAAITGESIESITDRISSSSELNSMRARRIARTETVLAANRASLVNAKETAIPMNKRWLSVQDKRTRHSHLIIDNNQVELYGYFNVGGVLIEAPGAPTTSEGLQTPAAQVVNCRCTLAYQVIK